MDISIVKPCLELLPSYLEALREGDFIAMQLGFGDKSAAEIERDPAAYIAAINDPKPFTVSLQGRTYTVSRHELLWISDGTRFLGTVALRYHGDKEIIDEYAGHVGLAIRPALLNRGYGVRAVEAAIEQITRRMQANGVDKIFLTCDAGNRASARLIEYFGGKFIEERPDLSGKGRSRRFELGFG